MLLAMGRRECKNLESGVRLRETCGIAMATSFEALLFEQQKRTDSTENYSLWELIVFDVFRQRIRMDRFTGNARLKGVLHAARRSDSNSSDALQTWKLDRRPPRHLLMAIHSTISFRQYSGSWVLEPPPGPSCQVGHSANMNSTSPDPASVAFMTKARSTDNRVTGENSAERAIIP